MNYILFMDETQFHHDGIINIRNSDSVTGQSTWSNAK